jgi:hypothetical protein
MEQIHRETAAEAAAQIVGQMSDEMKRDYVREEWAEGISLMLCDEWEHLADEDVLDAIDEILNP